MADIEKRRSDRFNFLFIAGMWFQDLFNYDFRRTERCIIPYATQQGEISFCAYNTGIGWRNIIEKMHMTATLTKWYEEHGRHEIFAGGKSVNMASKEHSLVLRSGSGRQGHPARPRREGHREDLARREAARAPGRARAQEDGRPLSPGGAQGTADAARFRASAAKKKEESRKSCTSRPCNSCDQVRRSLLWAGRSNPSGPFSVRSTTHGRVASGVGRRGRHSHQLAVFFRETHGDQNPYDDNRQIERRKTPHTQTQAIEDHECRHGGQHVATAPEGLDGVQCLVFGLAARGQEERAAQSILQRIVNGIFLVLCGFMEETS